MKRAPAPVKGGVKKVGPKKGALKKGPPRPGGFAKPAGAAGQSSVGKKHPEWQNVQKKTFSRWCNQVTLLCLASCIFFHFFCFCLVP